MPGGFCGALAEADADYTHHGNGVLKLKVVVCGYKDSVFFTSSQGKPVVYSATKNAWGYVTHVPDGVLHKMHSDSEQDNYGMNSLGPEAELIRSRFCSHSKSVSSHQHTQLGPSVAVAVAGRPPWWRHPV